MSRRFDLSQLMRVAVSDERSGMELYKAMEKRAGDKDLRKEFARLAQQELRHSEKFEQTLKDLEENQVSEQYPDEYADYLEMLVSENYSSDRREELTGNESDLEMVDLALRFERDQLALQREMGELLGAERMAFVQMIIDEERRHLVDLSTAKKRLRSAS